MNSIEVSNLRKTYGHITAVNNISFSVEKGSFFAFIGPNGAGKSTTINILCTLISCDNGQIYLNSHPLGVEDDQIRKEIGIVFQNGVLDDLLTVKENLMIRGSMYGYSKEELNKRILSVAQITEIKAILNRKYGTLSGGQKRRADIARALLHEPKILFLDEPTTGLDPKTRQSIWHCILNMRKNLGTTIFLTTHYMEEALNCDKVVVINNGKIVESGTPAYLKEKYTKDILKIYTQNANIEIYLRKNKLSFSKIPDGYSLYLNNVAQIVKIINDILTDIDGFEVVKGNMDDAFLTIIERSSKK